MMIDLRSDTITQPTAGMRAAMADAVVGDDVFGDDPTVIALEQRVAELFGHEAALFVVSGSLGNLLGVRSLVEPGGELLCDVEAHIVRHELGAHAAVHQVTTRTFASDHGKLTAHAVWALAAPDAGPYSVSTAAIAVENTQGGWGGVVQPQAELVELSRRCREAGVGLHLDGARLWNAHIATATPLADFGALFDTATVCLSKGLGAPIGSVLVASRERIAAARTQRKRLGAGWRQAGILAAAGLYALDHHLDRLADDHDHARELAALVPGAPVPETNMIMIPTTRPAADVVADAAAAGVAITAHDSRTVRAVTSLAVDAGECVRAGQVLAGLV